jgi:DEAD/DEAH box helicase domain-containing protein
VVEQSLFGNNRDSSAAFKAADDVLVFDLETQKEFAEVGGRDKPQLLKVSVVGVYSYRQDKFLCFEESEMNEFRALLEQSKKVVGFNIKHFDIRVLESYLNGFDWRSVEIIDIMEGVYNKLGHRLFLNSIAQSTLKEEKAAASGLEAVRMFKEGKMEELKNYCLEDVRITKEIYDFGRENSFLLYKSLDGVTDLKVEIDFS